VIKYQSFVSAFDSLLTVIQLCANAMAQDEGAWRRKAYVWRRLEKVLPDGAPYTRGSGASKRYAASAIPVIGVLLLVSNRFASVELLDAISRAILRSLTKNRIFSRCWASALARAAEFHYKTSATQEEPEKEKIDEAEANEVSASEHTFLTIVFPGPARDEVIVRCSSTPQITPGEEVDIYSVDLGYVFFALFNEGRGLLGEGFRLARPQRRARRARRS
jgi:hypothetical protein